jgi:pyruvate dehydrogenase E2 component (dihydrolipoamide acetyltransferase)
VTGPSTRDHSRMRRSVIRTVTASQQVPQYTVEADVDARPLLALRTDLVAQGEPGGPKMSVTDLLHAAVARTLTAHPLLNASWTESATLIHERIDLAFIVEVTDGMLTPVIRHADTRTPVELATARQDLTARAQGGTLRLDELVDATFTVSNLGALGVRRFSAMVLPPQSAVLAVGAVTPDGHLGLTLTLDHRVVDGAVAARFLADLRGRLEAPQCMTTPARHLEGSR